MTRDLTPAQRILCAVDTNELHKAQTLVDSLNPDSGALVGGIKLGLEFHSALGTDGVRAIAGKGLPIFLDLKFHDIPNTVAGAVRSAMEPTPAFMTIHASGGPAMIRAASDAAAIAAEAHGVTTPILLAVTVLTSLDQGDLEAVGQASDVASQVKRLGELAVQSGATGLVCAPFEVGFLRDALGPDVVLVVPGVRPSWAAKNDQKRVMTPAEAVAAGADHLVIGRPITAADDPADAALKIAEEIAAGV